jgi:autotransporter-associated beta strand protein
MPPRPHHRRRSPLGLERLEDRAVPAIHTWTGNGTSTNWSDAANWSGGVPGSLESGGTIVAFNTVASSNDNINNLVIDKLRFDTGAQVTLTLGVDLGISGRAFTSNVVDLTGNNTIAPLGGGTTKLVGQDGVVTFDLEAAGAPPLTVAASISGSVDVRKIGVESLDLTAPGLYTGTTRIDQGVFILDTNTPFGGLTGPVVVGDGIGPALSAGLSVGIQANQLPPLATVTVNPDGELGVSTAGDGLGTLILHGGFVSIATSLDIEPGGTVTADGVGSAVNGPGSLRLESGGRGVTFDVADGTGTVDLQVSAPIAQSGGAADLTKTGAGTLQLSATAAATYTGVTTIADGVVLLSTTTTDAGLSNRVVIGDDAGAARSAVLRLPNTTELPDNATVTVKGDGLLDVLATAAEDVRLLILGGTSGGGAVAVAAGGLLTLAPGAGINALATPTPNTISGPGSLKLHPGPGTFAEIFVDDGAAADDLVIGAVIDEATDLGIHKTGKGRLVLTADNTYAAVTTLTDGALEVDGNQPASPVVLTGGTLGGSGTVGPVSGTGGTVAPGLLTATAPVTLHTGSSSLKGITFAPLLSFTPGGPADQLAVTGTVALDGATLTPTLAGAATGAGRFVIIANDGTDPVTGTFTGLPEGSPVTVGGRQFTISYAGGDGNDVVLSTGATGSAGVVAASGSADGAAHLFTLTGGKFQPTGTAIAPFPGFGGEVRVARGDFNGDGVQDTVLVTGPGTKTLMAVVSGKDGSVLVPPTDPFGDANFTSGGFVTAGDIDHDGRAEWVVTPELKGGPRVVIFHLLANGSFDLTSPGQPSLVANFFGIGDPGFRDGDRAALGDVNGDGILDVFSIAAFNGGPRTALYDGKDVLTARSAGRDPVKLAGDFFADTSGQDEGRGGRSIAAGDVNGDGKADLIVTGDNLLGTGNRITVFSGADLAAGKFPGGGATPLADFAVGALSGAALVSLAAVDVDGDPRADLAVGSGAGQPSLVTVYPGKTLSGTAEPASTAFDPFGAVTLDGVFVG